MNVEFKLEAFEGPLDLLLHLIDKNKIDIYDIPVGELTEQYISYISDMKNRNMENMSEFIVMAATLVEIKTNMLLPKVIDEEEETDPREELVNRLEEYKRFKKAAEILGENQRFGEAYIFKGPDLKIMSEFKNKKKDISEIIGEADISALYQAFLEVLKRREIRRDNIRSGFDSVERDLFTIEDKIQYISDLIFLRKKFRFVEAFKENVSRQEIVITFLAVLELIKVKRISVTQEKNFDDIFISAV